MMECVALGCGLLALGAVGPRAEPAVTLPERTVWDVVRSPDGDFAFSMPVRPERVTRNVRGAAGTLAVLSYSCTFDGSDYRLQRIESPQAVPPQRVLAELNRLKGRQLKENPRLVQETRVVVDGVIGDDFTVTAAPTQGTGIVTMRTRHFIRDHFYYALTVTSPPDRPLADDAPRFLSSITFEAVVKAHYARMKAGPLSPRRTVSNAPPTPARPEPKAPVPKAPVPKARVKLADATPEDAFRTFLLALAAQDEETLRAVALPDDEFPWLLRGRPASPGVLATMRTGLERAGMRRLKAGDAAKMADGDSRRLQPEDIRADRVVLWPVGATYASRIERVDGHWKVDPRPFIATRKAVEARGKGQQPRTPSRPSPRGTGR